ncbi:MAG: hypothetical protein IPO98_12550 [Saprospiraceae bacterium]|nr:hypothetical protein [Saprospiraceae bacterium]
MAEILLAENYVRECNVLVSNMYVHNKGGFNKAQIEGIAKMIDKMQILKAKYKTNTIIIFTNDLTFFYYQSRGDYKKALDIAKENQGKILLYWFCKYCFCCQIGNMIK